MLLSATAFALLFVILLERHGGYRPYVSLLAVRDTERVLRVTVESFLLALLGRLLHDGARVATGCRAWPQSPSRSSSP